MTNSGEVDLKTVIEVLRNNRVAVTAQKDGTFIIEKDETIEVHNLKPQVSKRMLQYLKRKFDVPIHHFYNPLMSTKSDGEKPQ